MQDATKPDQPLPNPQALAEPEANNGQPLTPEDFYYEGPYLVFTADYHRKRGYCCNSDCRHCPYK